mmetsp:Transcript_19438/g.54791  ORF Transcript_19438/g.54791 Transcript_19438/m.54791 type:complete len:110 (-) Transcript_19438:474-803(-)
MGDGWRLFGLSVGIGSDMSGPTGLDGVGSFTIGGPMGIPGIPCGIPGGIPCAIGGIMGIMPGIMGGIMGIMGHWGAAGGVPAGVADALPPAFFSSDPAFFSADPASAPA